MATVSIAARADELREAATRRWLVKDELMTLLLQHTHTRLPIHHTLQVRPPSGTLMFYDVSAVPDFKKDGWRWQKRKDHSGRVREDRAKLVINRQVIILGTYVHSAESPTFHRRSYYLRDSNPHIMLVHYFDEIHKADPAMGSLLASTMLQAPSASAPPSSTWTPLPPPGKGLKRALPPSAVALPMPPPPAGVAAPLVNRQGPLPPPIKLDPCDPSNSVDVIMKDCFAMDYLPLHPGILGEPDAVPPVVSNAQTSLLHSAFDLLKTPEELSAMPSLYDDALFGDVSAMEAPPMDVIEPVEITDFSPDWDFVEGGAKILICLAAPLPSSVNDPSRLFVEFGAGRRAPAERISDTVIRCAAPPVPRAGPVSIFLCYCMAATSLDCVQLSIAKSFQYRTPMSTPSTTANGGTKENDVCERSHGGAKRSRSPHPLPPQRERLQERRASNPEMSILSAFADTDLDERQCKIRVVERLTEFHHAIRTTSSSVDTDHLVPVNRSDEQLQRVANEPKDDQTLETSQRKDANNENLSENLPLDDGSVDDLSDQDLESLSEQLLERVVRQLVSVAHTSEELLEELNSLDETGLSLLHYVSFYNYSHLIPLLLAHGAHVNQQSTQGHTPLHLAAGCGHQDVVDALVEAGADLFALDFDGLTPADRAEKSDQIDVAARLRQLMGSEEPNAASPLDWQSCFDMEIEDVATSDGFARSSRSPEATTEDGDLDALDVRTTRTSSLSYAGENQEHNRKLLLGAFSTMSLHDKCALSLSLSRDLSSSSSRRRESNVSDDAVAAASAFTSGSSVSSPAKPTDQVLGNTVASVGGESESMCDSDVKSVIADDEINLNKLEAAMELMGPDELHSLEEEARVIQHNVRAWLLRRNYRNMRETTKRLQEATRTFEDQQKQQEEARQAKERELMSQQERSERERAAVTVQAAARTMLARKSFLQTRNVTIRVQAATRGVLCRKNFARMKTHALASLVIQRNVREWLSKQPGSSPHSSPGTFNEGKSRTDGIPMSPLHVSATTTNADAASSSHGDTIPSTSNGSTGDEESGAPESEGKRDVIVGELVLQTP